MGYRYQAMDINTASPAELVVKLYQGALRHGRQAQEHQREGRVAERGRSLSKAIAIVSELQGALDLEQGGEIASNLNALYSFVNERFLEANMQGKVELIEEAVGVLDTLSEAWVEIARGPAVAAGMP